MGIVAVFKISHVILLTLVINLGISVQHTGVVGVQLIVSIHLAIGNGLENVDRGREAIAGCSYDVILSSEDSCIVDLDRDICAARNVGSQSGRHGIVDDIVVLCVARRIGNLCNGTELNGISDLVVAHNTPFAAFIMLDLLVQRRLIALRSCGHVSDNLHQVSCISEPSGLLASWCRIVAFSQKVRSGATVRIAVSFCEKTFG